MSDSQNHTSIEDALIEARRVLSLLDDMATAFATDFHSPRLSLLDRVAPAGRASMRAVGSETLSARYRIRANEL